MKLLLFEPMVFTFFIIINAIIYGCTKGKDKKECFRILLIVSAVLVFYTLIHAGIMYYKISETRIKKEYIITNYKGFKINKYVLKDPIFIDFNQIYNYFSIENLLYTITNEQNKLIENINNLREKHNIKALNYNEEEKLSDYFNNVKNGSFYCLGNIFKLSNTKYLFIYPIGLFKIKIIQNDNDINKILLNSILNNIIILEKESDEYILLYKNEKENLSYANNNIGIHIYNMNYLESDNKLIFNIVFVFDLYYKKIGLFRIIKL